MIVQISFHVSDTVQERRFSPKSYFVTLGACVWLPTLLLGRFLNHLEVDGLITSERFDLEPMQMKFAHDHKSIKSFEQCVEELKPTAIIGLAGAGKLFTKSVLQKMAKYNDRYGLKNFQKLYSHFNGLFLP